MRKRTVFQAMLVAALVFAATRPAVASRGEEKHAAEGSGEKAKITGVVMNYDTKQPVTDATVRLYMRTGEPDDEGWAPVEDTKISAQLDSDGKFSLAGVETGTYLLVVEKSQTFATARHEDSETVRVEVTSQASVDVGRVWVQFRR